MGEDYDKFFSPVAKDSSTRIAFAITLYKNKWVCHSVDIEAAFLNPTTSKPMFIEWPQGCVELGLITEKEKKEMVIRTDKGMYGSVDAAINWMRDFSNALTCGFNYEIRQSKADPCVFYHTRDMELKMMIVIHVDDMIIAGEEPIVIKFKFDLKKHYTITDLGELNVHLGVRYEWKTNENNERYLVSSMNEYANEIIKVYEDEFEKTREFETPGYANEFIARNNEEITKHEL